ncbi:helix-turn-helix domain-containing protein [uncultured Oscillibacter sp.]|uniref:helix-turn-helix domain-containing protein n=1 Tax=uncultured Oscillibacter sp. TaxID=876091 RepID=UPI0025DAB37C|nr:helix-turn-helix domain-containing protein [uncultured Oscillibacter sp.]
MPALLDHEKLCKEMKGQALKQEPLAEQLDISVRHLRNLCSRDTNVSSALLYKLSEVLQVPMRELLTTQEESE